MHDEDEELEQTMEDAQEGTQSPLEGSEEEQEPDTFPRSYVEELRAESAAHRVKAKRAEDLESALQALAIAHYAKGVLADVQALEWSDEMSNDEGKPDGEKIRLAAEDLVKRRPSLGRPTGDVLQGEHGSAPAPFSWSMLGKLV